MDQTGEWLDDYTPKEQASLKQEIRRKSREYVREHSDTRLDVARMVD